LNGGSGRRKAATYTRNNINTEQTHTYIHALNGIRTHDPSVRASEDSSCLRPRGHCDWQILLLVTTIPFSPPPQPPTSSSCRPYGLFWPVLQLTIVLSACPHPLTHRVGVATIFGHDTCVGRISHLGNTCWIWLDTTIHSLETLFRTEKIL
jgi:hypothetical protein